MRSATVIAPAHTTHSAAKADQDRDVTRHALAYVLNNWRRHREDFANGREIAAHLDPYSSGVSFDGWTITFAKHPDYNPLPVSPPQTRLLRDDWKRFGRIDPQECPGPLW